MLGGLIARVNAQVSLPEGPNRDLVERMCGSCHGVEMVAINGRSEENWNVTLEEMTGYGLRLTPVERAQVLKYLSVYLPPR
jgi:mono/diheme cytochrome c family protein